MDPVIDDAAIDDLGVSDGGAVAPEATDGPIVIEPDAGGKPIDGIYIAIPIEAPAITLGQ